MQEKESVFNDMQKVMGKRARKSVKNKYGRSKSTNVKGSSKDKEKAPQDQTGESDGQVKESGGSTGAVRPRSSTEEKPARTRSGTFSFFTRKIKKEAKPESSTTKHQNGVVRGSR